MGVPKLLALFKAALPLLQLVINAGDRFLKRNTTWAICHLCRGSQSASDVVQQVIPTLELLIGEPGQDEAVRVDAVWAVAFLTNGIQSNAEEVQVMNICLLLIETLDTATSRGIHCNDPVFG